MRSWRDVSDSRLSNNIRFSPNVLYEVPCDAKALITRFVMGLVVGEPGVRVTMYCSLRTSYVMSALLLFLL